MCLRNAAAIPVVTGCNSQRVPIQAPETTPRANDPNLTLAMLSKQIKYNTPSAALAPQKITTADGSAQQETLPTRIATHHSGPPMLGPALVSFVQKKKKRRCGDGIQPRGVFCMAREKSQSPHLLTHMTATTINGTERLRRDSLPNVSGFQSAPTKQTQRTRY